MFVPVWALIGLGLIAALFVLWALLAASGRNPLPFPDNGSRIFSASSEQAKAAIVELLARHGLKERFQFDSSGIRRSILWDGTIINLAPPEVVAKLGGATSSIGLVASDPVAAAQDAAAFLRDRNFEARVVTDAEPELPIAFVVTDAFAGTALNFRKPAAQMPRPK